MLLILIRFIKFHWLKIYPFFKCYKIKYKCIFLIKKINESISIGNIDQALLDYKKLLIPNSSVKTSIQNALNSIIPGNNKPFSNEQVLNITRTYLDFFIKQEPSSYSILLNKEGKLE